MNRDYKLRIYYIDLREGSFTDLLVLRPFCTFTVTWSLKQDYFSILYYFPILQLHICTLKRLNPKAAFFFF